MFSHSNPSQWKLEDEDEEEFPAPPTQDEVDNATNENSVSDQVVEEDVDDDLVLGIIDVTENEDENVVKEMELKTDDNNMTTPTVQPTPPPRDSSKEYMREWSREENSASLMTTTQHPMTKD